MGELRSAYEILVRKSEGKNPVEISIFRWDNNIKNNSEIWFEVVDEFEWLRIGSSSGVL
jgi:hypothetical protein